MGFFRKIFQSSDSPPPDRATTAPLTPELLPDYLPGEGRRHLQIGVAHVHPERSAQPRTDAHLVMLGGYDGNDSLPDFGVLALASGLTSYPLSEQAGTAAVRTAVRSIAKATYLQSLELEPIDDLPSLHVAMGNCFEEANWSVKAEADGGAVCMTVLLVLGQQLVVGHLGNNRAYLWRQGQLKRITEDHPVAGGCGENDTPVGTIYGEDRRQSGPSLLGQTAELQVDITSHEIAPGDALLLCSPGIWKSLPDETIAGAYQRYDDANRCAEALVRAGQDVGGEIELTAIAAAIP
ncbi:MAG: hypothetical protein JXA97_06615 [Anaerolineales bacterium]|nr:hypothetical protein [Anaerolineales bacterium]